MRKFILRAGTSRYFYEMVITKYAKDMYAIGKKIGVGKNDYSAVVITEKKGYRLGMVLLSETYLCMEIVSHEMLHAAMYHEQILGHDPTKDEESLARLVGKYCKDCIKKLDLTISD